MQVTHSPMITWRCKASLACNYYNTFYSLSKNDSIEENSIGILLDVDSCIVDNVYYKLN